MRLILDLIGPEQPELFALELKKMLYLTLFTLQRQQFFTNQHLTWPKNIYNHKILDEFDYGSNWIKKTGVICP